MFSYRNITLEGDLPLLCGGRIGVTLKVDRTFWTGESSIDEPFLSSSDTQSSKSFIFKFVLLGMSVVGVEVPPITAVLDWV